MCSVLSAKPATSELGSPDASIKSIRGARSRHTRTDHDAIDIDRLEVSRAEHVLVRGPSGCAKTTLLSLIAGVLTATSGQIAPQRINWASLSGTLRDRLRADRVGQIFQQFSLLPYLSVLDRVVLPCGLPASRFGEAGNSPDSVRRSASGWLPYMGLGSDCLMRIAAQLSVGQQQRVAAARALIGQPEPVIADEPTSALDEALRESFVRVLLEACRQAGSALIFVSHDARPAPRFLRRVDPAAGHAASSVASAAEAA